MTARSKNTRPPPSNDHLDNTGRRRARITPTEDLEDPMRVEGDPEWDCDKTERRKIHKHQPAPPEKTNA